MGFHRFDLDVPAANANDVRDHVACYPTGVSANRRRVTESSLTNGLHEPGECFLRDFIRNLRVAELVPGERLVATVSDSYEASGYLESYPRADGPRCFLANGGMAGLMNLVYQGDITRRPSLTEELYREVFGHPRSFRSRERLCAAKGDSHCEFIVERMQG